jgi:glycosyltransferase involved in cell wall biosynthesis
LILVVNSTDKSPLVYDAEEGGHRGRGVELIAGVVGGVGLIARPRAAFWRLLRNRATLVWQTADYALLMLLFVSIARAILCRRTVALCYRNDRFPGPMAIRSWGRRAILAFLSQVPNVEVVRIFPPPAGVRTRFQWLFDPEWWDLLEAPLPDVPVNFPMTTGRTMLFIGNVSPLKGTEFFIATAEEARRRGSDLSFVLVGHGENLTPEQFDRFKEAEGVIVEGYPSDSEFVAFMKRADFLWCCYHPSYNQSSGIFGRAIQLRIPVIVAKESLLEDYLHQFGDGIAVSYGDAGELLRALEGTSFSRMAPDHRSEIHAAARLKLLSLCGLSHGPTV